MKESVGSNFKGARGFFFKDTEVPHFLVIFNPNLQENIYIWLIELHILQRYYNVSKQFACFRATKMN